MNIVVDASVIIAVIVEEAAKLEILRFAVGHLFCEK